MIEINNDLIQDLFDKALNSERKRMNYDLRTSQNDSSQRMLNALMPGTVVPIHRHPHSNENVLLLCGKLVEVLYEDPLKSPLKGDEVDGLVEIERISLDPSVGNFGCVVPANTWHTVEVLEASVIYEAKDGRYGQDGSESWEDFNQNRSFGKTSSKEDEPNGSVANVCTYESSSELGTSAAQISSPVCAATLSSSKDDKPSALPQNIPFNNSLGDLKKNIEYLIGMERHSGSMEVITPLYVSRMLNVPLEEVEKAMKTL